MMLPEEEKFGTDDDPHRPIFYGSSGGGSRKRGKEPSDFQTLVFLAIVALVGYAWFKSCDSPHGSMPLPVQASPMRLA